MNTEKTHEICRQAGVLGYCVFVHQHGKWLWDTDYPPTKTWQEQLEAMPDALRDDVRIPDAEIEQ